MTMRSLSTPCGQHTRFVKVEKIADNRLAKFFFDFGFMLLKLRRRHRLLVHSALLLATLAWLVSAASLVCGRPLLHKAMAMDADCAMAMAMADGMAPAQHPIDQDCSEQPCLQDSQPYDGVQPAKSDAPQFLALLVAVLIPVLIWPPYLLRSKPPDPPDLKPIPLFQRFCVLRN